ncbi:MAG: radical SAM protein [Treponema sp.]|jgi:radical SAM superfamily enzyme YgiQ (UPF0313 family)|nr:radical SAM protein [Treponema sp.]
MKHILLIQPPFVQLNGPYPSLYYLRAFLRNRGVKAAIRDHSIGLFGRIFCRDGLERIFADAEAQVGTGPGKGMDRQTWKTAARFLSEAGRWIRCIDRLLNFLRGRDREWGHSLALANGVFPGGPRFDACLEGLGGNPLPEDAPLLASKLLADLADFIRYVLDPGFSLVRYGDSTCLAVSADSTDSRSPAGDFAGVLANSRGYILRNFYTPYLDKEWAELDCGDPVILGLSIPFPGSLAGALCCAASAKRYFGTGVRVIAGGGYVNTELRFLSDPRVFDYVDYLSFDRGYGSLDAILEREEHVPGSGEGLYKTMFRAAGNQIIADPAIAGGGTLAARGREIDDWASRTVFPDYSDVDFSRYICPVDDLNPMHRLWTDGRWLKVYLAHGCYWQKCRFCDTTLDYIRSYRKVDVEALYRHLREQAEQTGVFGVHLVDEAAPPASLIRLALLNLDGGEGPPLSFWGNIRFEKTFDPDTAALLAAGGLVGVSGGVEVATEAGFERIGKGITLAALVRCCAAFKEAGILIHAYLIYGYWDQDEQEIVDSAEITRQFFAAGLLDSAFWHPFVLTRHSGLYAAPPSGLTCAAGKPCFALNDLSFEGEERFHKYGEGLDRLLAAWMAGECNCPVDRGFSFKVKRPAVAPGLVAGLLNEYARDRDRSREVPPSPSGGLIFLGSRPLVREKPGGAELYWYWRREEHTLSLARGAASLLLPALGRGLFPAADFYTRLLELLGPSAPAAWKVLREGGLTSVTDLTAGHR